MHRRSGPENLRLADAPEATDGKELEHAEHSAPLAITDVAPAQLEVPQPQDWLAQHGQPHEPPESRRLLQEAQQVCRRHHQIHLRAVRGEALTCLETVSMERTRAVFLLLHVLSNVTT